MSRRELQDAAEAVIHRLMDCGSLPRGSVSLEIESTDTGGFWCKIAETGTGWIDLWYNRYRSHAEEEFYYGFWTKNKQYIERIQSVFCHADDLVVIEQSDEVQSERGYIELTQDRAELAYNAFITHSSRHHRWFGRYASSTSRTEVVDESTVFYADVLRYDDPQYLEGISQTSLMTRYERNPSARAACLRIHGYTCKICDFDFDERYGSEVGRSFIHVHHLDPVSQGTRMISPKDDLLPVCPNCHAMLHRRNPPISPDELRFKLT